MAGNRSLLAAAGLLAACGTPIVKSKAFDREVLLRHPLPADLIGEPQRDERVVTPDPRWLAVDARAHLTFANYRQQPGGDQFCLVLECDPAANRLRLLPLAAGETPLDALGSPERRTALRRLLQGSEPPAGAFTVALDQVVAERRLGSPLPTPKRIIAVAANFPSHLETDLDIPRRLHGAIAGTPPRVFQKYPPTPPPGSTLAPDYPFNRVIGPFDTLLYPQKIQLPADELGKSPRVTTNLDYEAEVGVVLGRTLSWNDVRGLTDDELYAAVAGYVLLTDVKARNPQVFERALSRGDSPSRWSQPYLTGDASIDLLLGNWDESTCAWWSYAASVGEVVTIGPWFVAADDQPVLPPRALVCARTYAPADVRGAAIPKGRAADVFYLRQCSTVTEDLKHPDAMLWTVPQILRGTLDPKSALAFTGGERQLHAGDVISLGTPGGIVLTVGDRGLYRFLDFVLFWWDAIDWHDGFFGKDQQLYLHDGDRLFLWAEGLGCQVLPVQSVLDQPTRPEPETRPTAPADAKTAEPPIEKPTLKNGQ